MQMLITDSLTLSQAQRAQLVLRPSDMSQVLAAALVNLCSASDDNRAIVTHDALPVLTVDATRIAQVFQNPAGNAINYRKPDEEARIHVSALRDQSNCWTFSVQDNGLVFDDSCSDQILPEFKRQHGKEVAGTGIGLAICRKIVETHDGRIWAASEPGVGSHFYFALPERRTV